jgi:hypothetical protein
MRSKLRASIFNRFRVRRFGDRVARRTLIVVLDFLILLSL